MVTRLSAPDAEFFRLENTSTPMYVGTLSILRRPRSGLSYETLLHTVEQRLPQIPRYRQKVGEVTMGLARPVWIDDRDFDITYHIRRSALPSPGSDAQLHDLVARLGSRPLDKSRPLWEMYLVEGLENDRFALIGKSHLSLVDGIDTVDLGQVLLDAVEHTHAVPSGSADSVWHPLPEPTPLEMVGDALLESAQDPAVAVENLRGLLTGALEGRFDLRVPVEGLPYGLVVTAVEVTADGVVVLASARDTVLEPPPSASSY